VNDQFGHQAGDHVLEKLAEIILNNQRIGIDYAFRYGGEEFAILSSNTNGQEMKMYLERLLTIVRETVVIYKDDEIKVTLSAGVCEVSFNESPESLIANSDAAMYKAKNSGRNQVLLHSV